MNLSTSGRIIGKATLALAGAAVAATPRGVFLTKFGARFVPHSRCVYRWLDTHLRAFSIRSRSQGLRRREISRSAKRRLQQSDIRRHRYAGRHHLRRH